MNREVTMLQSIPLLPVQRQQLQEKEFVFCQAILHELDDELQKVDEKLVTTPEGNEKLRLWFDRALAVERQAAVLDRLKELSETLEVLDA